MLLLHSTARDEINLELFFMGEKEGRKQRETAGDLVRAAVGGESKRGGTSTFTLGSGAFGGGSGSHAGVVRKNPILLSYAPIGFHSLLSN
jgi:hypothetical protein